MSILSVQAIQAGLVDVLPSLSYINTTDSVAEVTVTGYLNKEVQSGTSFSLPSLAIVATKETPTSASVTATYNITHASGEWSLVATSGSGGVTPYDVQRQVFNTGSDVGSADAYEVNLSPAVGTYTDGMFVTFSPAENNVTTTPTLSINGLPPTEIALSVGPVQAGDLDYTKSALVQFSIGANKFFLLTPAVSYGGAGGGVTAGQVQADEFNIGTDSGAANAYEVSLNPAITSYTDGLLVMFNPNATNTTTSTLDVNGIGAVEIYTATSSGVVLPGDMQGTALSILRYSVGFAGWLLLNPYYTTITPEAILRGFLVQGVDTGTADAHEVVLDSMYSILDLSGNTPPTNLFIFNAAGSNTIPHPTLTINGSNPGIIRTITGGDLQPDDIIGGQPVMVIGFETSELFYLLNPRVSTGVTPEQVQKNAFNLGAESGAGDDFEVTLDPAITSYTQGLVVEFTSDRDNATTAPTLNVNGLGAKEIYTANGDNPMIGDISQVALAICRYETNGDYFIIENPNYSQLLAGRIASNLFCSGTDTGTDTEYQVSTDTWSVYADIQPSFDFHGMFGFPAANTNTDLAPTLSINGTSPMAITRLDGETIAPGDIEAGQVSLFFLYGGNARLLNPRTATAIAAYEVQESAFNSGIDSGAADAYVVNLTPAAQSYANGMPVYFIAANSNATTTPTLTVDALSTVTIIKSSGALEAGDIVSGQLAFCVYSGGQFELINPATTATSSAPTITEVQDLDFNRGFATISAPNVYTTTLTPSLTAAPVSGSIYSIEFQFNNSSTTPTLEIDGQGDFPITYNGGELKINDLGATTGYQLLLFTGSSFDLLNPVGLPAASQSASLAIGAAYQNTFGYDVILTVYLSVTAATTADITLGVGPTNTPTDQTLISGLTVAALTIIPITISLPNNYYALLDTSGTITMTISGQQAMPV